MSNPSLVNMATGQDRPVHFLSPKTLNPAQREIHDLAHLPFDEGCEICRLTRGLNAQHGPTLEHMRTIPLLVADDCFLRWSSNPTLRTVWVMRLYPYKIYFAACVPRKGPEPTVVKRIVGFLRDSGLTHFAFRCDREASITAMLDEAVAILGRSYQRITNDEEHRRVGAMVPEAKDDEPDAPTHIPAVALPLQIPLLSLYLS